MRFKGHKHVVDFLKKKFSKPSNIFNLTEISVDIYTDEVITYLNDQKYQQMKKGKSFSSVGERSGVDKKEIETAKCNLNKDRKQKQKKKKNLREYWTNSKIHKKSIHTEVIIGTKYDNSHRSIKKKQDNEKQCLEYRRYQNKKKITDDTLTENIQSEGMAIDPCCHVLKRKLSNTSGEKIYHDNVYCK